MVRKVLGLLLHGEVQGGGLLVHDNLVDGVVDNLGLAEGLQEEVELVLNVECEHDAGCAGTGLVMPQAMPDMVILPACGHLPVTDSDQG